MHLFQKRMILLVILFTPFFSISEVVALFSGAITSQVEALTPFYVKIIKDEFIALIMFAGLIQIFTKKKIFAEPLYYFFLLTALVSLLRSVYSLDAYTIAAGVRWIVPLLLIPFLYNNVDDDIQEKIASVLLVLFVFGFVLQCFQLFYAQGWYGLNAWGLSKRNPGFYLIPSSMACFSIYVLYYVYFFKKRSLRLKIVMYLLVPVSVVLTASGTGYVALMFFYGYLFYLRVRQKIVVAVCCLAIFIVGAMSLPMISDREDIYTSLIDRIVVFKDLLGLDKLLISSHFGEATNTARQLNDQIDDMQLGIIADSTLTSMFHNLGMLSVVIFIVFIIKIVAINKQSISFFILLLPFIMSIVFYELFPANLLLSINLVYFMVDTKQKPLYTLKLGCSN